METYRQAAIQAGREPQVVLMRDAWVASSRAEAEAVYGPEVTVAYKYYWRNGLTEFQSIESEAELTLERVAFPEPGRLRVHVVNGEYPCCELGQRYWPLLVLKIDSCATRPRTSYMSRPSP